MSRHLAAEQHRHCVLPGEHHGFVGDARLAQACLSDHDDHSAGARDGPVHGLREHGHLVVPAGQEQLRHPGIIVPECPDRRIHVEIGEDPPLLAVLIFPGRGGSGPTHGAAISRTGFAERRLSAAESFAAVAAIGDPGADLGAGGPTDGVPRPRRSVSTRPLGGKERVGFPSRDRRWILSCGGG